MRIRLILLSFFLLFVWSPVSAEDGAAATVAILLKMCQSGSASESAYCLGKISGIADVMRLNGSLAHYDPRVTAICSNDTILYAAMVQSFINWATLHPEHWSDIDSLGIEAALTATWPCK